MTRANAGAGKGHESKRRGTHIEQRIDEGARKSVRVFKEPLRYEADCFAGVNVDSQEVSLTEVGEPDSFVGEG